MNYYEHHLGDYVRKAAHLSMVEDGAYRRLLDAYYIREKPLPPTVAACCKLVRATGKAERAAVAMVLAEFFEEREDGYHQGRADDEIARFQDKRDKARASADARWSHRRPPSADHANGYANASASEPADAMRTHSEGNAPHTRARAHPGTAARPSPVPSPQTPEEKKNTTHKEPSRGGVGGFEPTRAGMLCRAMKAVGIGDPNPGHPELISLIEAGATESEFLGAAQTAAKKKKGFAYALGVLTRQRLEAADKAKGLHRGPIETAKPWDHDGGTIRKTGIQLGLGDWDRDAFDHGEPKAETFAAYTNRVRKALAKREEHHA